MFNRLSKHVWEMTSTPIDVTKRRETRCTENAFIRDDCVPRQTAPVLVPKTTPFGPALLVCVATGTGQPMTKSNKLRFVYALQMSKLTSKVWWYKRCP